MSSLTKARTNSIFPVERRGDTLVVVPQGDAIGFSPHQIQVELRGIEKILSEFEPMNLIVDLEHTNYFGSEMIGFINRMGSKARNTGGRTGVCNISADMQGIFEVMNLDEIWESYDSTSSALRAIAKIPFGERIAQHQKWMWGAAALAVIAVAILYFPWPDRKRDYYIQMINYSNELQEMRRMGAGQAHRNGFRKKVERELKPILVELSDASANGDQGATFLYVAGKQCLLPMLGANGMTRDQLEEEFVVHMTNAAKYIDNVEPPAQAVVQCTITKPLGAFQDRAQTSQRGSSNSRR